MSAAGACAILAALEAHAAERPDGAAVARVDAMGEPREVWTWSRLAEESRRAGAALAVAAREREIAVLVGANAAATILWHLAALHAGVRLLPVHPASTPAEVRGVVERSGACVVIGPAGSADLGLPRLGLDARGAACPGVRGNGGGLVLLSSGTTGGPKLALRVAHALDADARNVVQATGLCASDAVLLAVPACHSYGVDMIVASVLAGAALHVLEPFDPAAAAAALRRHSTVFPGVPVMLEALARCAARETPRLRLAICAGSPLPERVARAFAGAWGQRAGQLYGATELGSVTLDHPGDPRFTPGSVGRPMSGVSIRILDPDDPEREAATGEEGQVAVRAPSMFSGYLGEEALLVDGHFLTGDLGRLDSHGRLFITGRLKLLVDVGGLKVNPQEVEQALAAHPGVAECVVTPLPITDTVTRLHAAYVPRASPPDERDLREHLRGLLAAHKIPRVLEPVDALPRSATGKVLRRAVGVAT